MKKFIIIITALIIFLNPVLDANASCRSDSWFIKRNGNKRPQIVESQKIIYGYDGYYIDEKVCDNSENKVIYLTFDLGYENGNASRILDALKEHGVQAAFFVLDNIIVKNTDLVTRMLNEGHLICNHTRKHKDLSSASEEEIKEELLSLEKLMEEKTGEKMAKYFRFPEGRYSETALKCVKELGYKTIFWSFAYADWDNSHQMNSEKAFNKIISNPHNGAVMLFHPTSKTNADIFPELIKEWKRMGYRFGTLDELTSQEVEN